MANLKNKELKILSSCLHFCMQDGNVEEDLNDDLKNWDNNNNGGKVTANNSDNKIDFDELIDLQNLLLSEINNNKPIALPTETWVELYGVLSNYVLEYSSLDPITKIEPNGDEVYTEEKQDEYNHIVGDIEDILRTFFRKEDE